MNTVNEIKKEDCKLKEKQFDFRQLKKEIENSPISDWIKAQSGLRQEAVDFAQVLGCILARLTSFKIKDAGKNIITYKLVRDTKQAKQALTKNQFRTFFGEVKNIEMQMNGRKENFSKIKSRLILLEPKLSYQYARQKTDGMYLFLTVIQKALEGISKRPEEFEVYQFDNFVKFLEAILAYHKFYGGN